jgi:hypothetical protein
MLGRERWAIGPDHDGRTRRDRDGCQHAVAEITVRVLGQRDVERHRDALDGRMMAVWGGPQGSPARRLRP